MSATAAPEWICRVALEAVDHDFWRASELRLAQELQKTFGDDPLPGSSSIVAAARRRADEINTRAHEEVRAQGERDGQAAAIAAIERGDLHFLAGGLVMGCAATCPRCLIRQWYSFDAGLPDRASPCPLCGTPRVHLVATGCVVDEATRAFNPAFNAMIEQHLRATVNPAFQGEDVRDEGSGADDDAPEPIDRSLVPEGAPSAATADVPAPASEEQRVAGEAVDRGDTMLIRATPTDRALDWNPGEQAELVWEDGTRSGAAVELRTGKLLCPPGSTVQLLLRLAEADAGRHRVPRAVVVEREATRVIIEIA
jgi:hypothetical protein